MSYCAKDRAIIMHGNGIRYGNGKWFDKDENEIKDIHSHILLDYNLQAGTPRHAIETAEVFRMMYKEDDLWWFDPLVVRRAKQLPPLEVELPFDIHPTFYVMLNILLNPQDSHMCVLYGIGNSGKSTYLNIVKQIFEDYFACSFNDLANKEFIRSLAIQHRLICQDEMDCGNIESFDSIKSICTHNSMVVNCKNQQPFTLPIVQSKIFYCTNKAPRFTISDTGMRRRIVVWEFCKPIPKEKLNPKFQNYKFSIDELTFIVQQALKADMTDWYERYFEHDTLKCLLLRNPVYLFAIKNGNVKSYGEYKDFCFRKGYKPMSEHNYDETIEVVLEDTKRMMLLSTKPKNGNFKEVDPDGELPW